MAMRADALMASGLAVFAALTAAATGQWQTNRLAPDALAYALIIAAALPLIVRRRWPLPVMFATTAAVSAYLVIGYPFGPILLLVPVAVYTVASRLPIVRAAIACAAALLVLLAHLIVEPESVMTGLGPGAAWIVVPFAIGVVTRLNREAGAKDKADHARRVADEERMRIAQEVHDVVGHGLAAIHMQSEVALHVLAKRPEQAEAALTAISRTSKEALDELRATLAVVRHAPGLERIDLLVARITDAGVPVKLEITGEQRPLGTAVDLAAYRIIQESLTNVLRHAGPAIARVTIDYEPGQVTIEIADTGVGTKKTKSGQGIEGMRERAESVGGWFEAGPAQGEGWRVRARLPA